MIERVAQADREVRSSPIDKRLVLEQLVMDLAKIGNPARTAGALSAR